MVQNLVAILDIVYFQTVNDNVELYTTTMKKKKRTKLKIGV